MWITKNADALPLEEMEHRIKTVCDQIADLLIAKNKAYGNSAIKPLRIFSRAPVIEQINVRLDDKLSRIACGGANFEGEDTEMDLVGYLILKQIAKQLQVLEDF